MGTLNVANRTLAIMDNLPFLRSLNNECIDLIAIDPPFAANETFKSKPKPPISEREFSEEVALANSHDVQHNEGIGETRVKDYWTWDNDVHPDWKARIEDDYPRVFSVIQAIEACATENEAAYICFMAARLIECHRILKPTGSIYIHCDYRADSYLRMLLDAIFGAKNPDPKKNALRNEISWCYGGRGMAKKWFNRKHDTILFYVKNPEKAFFDPVGGGRPVAEEHVSRYNKTDTEGRKYARILNSDGSYSNIYLKDSVVFEDWWTIPYARGNEVTGYSTQKPLALYERIIKASSKPGDVVLDIFAGCATTAVAAERLGRQWVACDMAYRAWTMLKRRFLQNGWKMSGTTDSSFEAMSKIKAALPAKDGKPIRSRSIRTRTIGPKESPKRDDTDPLPYHQLAPTRGGRKKTTQSATWSGRISKEEAKKLLIDRFGPVCWGCGYEPRRPNGTLDDTLLEVDHIRARKSSEGTQGNDELYNLAVLHRTCNGIKRNKLTLEELRTHNALNGLLYVDNPGHLVDLFEATQFAQEQIAQHVAIHGYQSSMPELRQVAESPNG